MLDKSSKKSERPMGDTTSEMRSYVVAAVDARRDSGRDRAVHEAARDLKMTPRRVLGLLHREVSRVWADELEQARQWYRDFCHAEARRLEARAAAMRVRQTKLDTDDWCDGVP